jgi:tetratricopeptide (TPR) repeat protein
MFPQSIVALAGFPKSQPFIKPGQTLSGLSKMFLVTFRFLVFVPLIVIGCAHHPNLEKGLGFYRENRLEKARPYFERAAVQDMLNPDAHAWLAETLRRLGHPKEAIVEARRALGIDSCHSFAHTVIANAYNPQYGSWSEANAESTWQHLLKAIECDSTDGNTWINIWVEAMRRGNRSLEEEALVSLMETEFLTQPALSYNRWVLQNLPENSILLTNGDMDTYPAVALQAVQHFRPDVGVVNLSLLNTPWYARIVRDRYGLPLPWADAALDFLIPLWGEINISKQIVKGWLEMQKVGTFPRPLVVAATVADKDFTPDSQRRLKRAGPFYICLPDSTDVPEDTVMMRISLQNVNPADFAGSFVSPRDRSAIRIKSSDLIAANVTMVALYYGYALLRSDRASEAYEMAAWAEQFEKNTKTGIVSSQEIKKLKKAAKQKMR